MRDIFTYPDNAGTYYIDPNYIGDATVGFYKRVDDLQDGTYRAWSNPTARASTEAILAGLGKYWKMYDNFNGALQVTFNDFWTYPLIEGSMREKGYRFNNFITEEIGDEVYITLNSTVDEFQYTSGDFLTFRAFDAFGAINNTNSYVKKNTATSVTLYDDAGLTQPREYSGINDQLRPTHFWKRDAATDPAYVDGVEMYFDSEVWIPTGTAVRFTQTLTNANPYDANNTINQADTNFFVKRINGTTSGIVYTKYLLYTDAAMTTPATFEEQLVGGATQTLTYTNTGGVPQLLNGVSAAGLDPAIKAELVKAPNFGWCRYWSDGGEPPPGYTPVPDARTQQKTYVYYYEESSDFISVLDWATGTSVPLYWIAEPGYTTSHYFEFIKQSNIDLDGFAWRKYDYPSTGLVVNASDLQADDTTPYWELDSMNIMLPGNRTYLYVSDGFDYSLFSGLINIVPFLGLSKASSQLILNPTYVNALGTVVASTRVAGGVYPGAKFNQEWYFEGASLAETPAAGELLPSGDIIDLDEDGYITGFTIGDIHSDDLGKFETSQSRLFTFSKKADTYVPPALTPEQIAALEDEWNTADYWLSPTYNANKYWPDTVGPESAVIKIVSPSTATISQNGKKYVRGSGFQSYQLEVEYPPMTYDEFREYYATYIAAQGQLIPFFFRLEYDGKNLLFPTQRKSSRILVKDSASIGDTTLLVEGFDSNDDSVFERGEIILASVYRNGYMTTVLNTVDSNIYGEAKIRISNPLDANMNAGSQIYQRPYHVVVTLGDDGFDYAIGVENYVKLKVTFDLDVWKA